MKAVSAKDKADIKAWEEESVKPCSHTCGLIQENGVKVLETGVAHCAGCDLGQNLWLCLTCGNLGCGRAQYGGLGGNGHGMSHFETTGHPVSLKMGSITPEGTAGFPILMQMSFAMNTEQKFLIRTSLDTCRRLGSMSLLRLKQR